MKRSFSVLHKVPTHNCFLFPKQCGLLSLDASGRFNSKYLQIFAVKSICDIEETGSYRFSNIYMFFTLNFRTVTDVLE